MNEREVEERLRSDVSLAVVEAAAGSGKTYQGAALAREVASRGRGRVLILTHTNAACDVFASRTQGCGAIDIRTIDSLVVELATAYRVALSLPEDVTFWALTTPGAYDRLRKSVALLLERFPPAAAAVAERYPVVICDEHQDADEPQHAIVMALHAAGSRVRVFGDPLQGIYGGRRGDRAAASGRWRELCAAADWAGVLDRPHRWINAHSRELGEWVCDARRRLKAREPIDLRNARPRGLEVFYADNVALGRRGGIAFDSAASHRIRRLLTDSNEMLVLASNNATVDGICSFMGHRVPIWEGHVRRHLGMLASRCREHRGDAVAIAEATVAFTSATDEDAGGGTVMTGFSPSQFGNRLVEEVQAGCTRPCRAGTRPARLQELGRCLLAQPDHRGVAALLERLEALVREDVGVRELHIDLRREYWEAIRLGEFEDPVIALAEVSRARSARRGALAGKAVSTIHKAKGLEVANVMVLPCDASHFGDTDNARCKLYVAISRATRRLVLVLSRRSATRLIVSGE